MKGGKYLSGAAFGFKGKCRSPRRSRGSEGEAEVKEKRNAFRKELKKLHSAGTRKLEQAKKKAEAAQKELEAAYKRVMSSFGSE